MAITATQNNPNGVVNIASGSFFDNVGGTVQAFNLGFQPTYVCWENVTDRIKHEWYDGAANGTTVKTAAAGTRTLDTADVAISVSSSGFSVGAAANIVNKQYRWRAEQ